jgi:hypothetical protein
MSPGKGKTKDSTKKSFDFEAKDSWGLTVKLC